MFLKKRISNLSLMQKNDKFAESSVDSAESQNLNKNNPRVSAHLESRPLRGAKNREQGCRSATADFLLEAEKRGSPPKSEKAAAFWEHNKKELGGAGRGVQPFLRKESSENNGNGIVETSTQIAESSLDSALDCHESANADSRNDEFIRDSSPTAQNDNFILNFTLFAESSKISPKYAIKG